MRGAHAALSPNFGAPATPAAWHTAQVAAYVALPSAAPLAPFAGAGGIAAAVTAGAAPGAGAAAAGAGAGAFGSTCTFAAGAMRLATSAGAIDASSFIEREPYMP